MSLIITTRSGKTLNAPAGAFAAIVAEYQEDRSDSQTDYFAHTTTRRVLIGWRFTKKESFAALRKAASLYGPAAHLNDKACEHRENYSMGGGNYLKAGGRHSDGVKVRSYAWAGAIPVDVVAMHLAVSPNQPEPTPDPTPEPTKPLRLVEPTAEPTIQTRAYTDAEHAAWNAGYRAALKDARLSEPKPTRKPRTPKPQPVVDKAAMTDAELFAYCKRWAVLGDARFLLRVGNLNETQRAMVKTLAAELETRKSTKADVELLWSIKQDCRANPRTFNPVTVEKAA